MQEVKNAQILFEGINSTIYLSDYEDYDKQVLVKVLRQEHPSPEQIALLENEYRISRRLDIGGVRQIYQHTHIDGKPALLLEYIEGNNLRHFFDQYTGDYIKFLKVALKICQVLGEIHQRGVIHKDLNSKNIIIDDKGEVYIIDFGISSRLKLKAQHLGNPERLEGTLSYISPEQTGRMNRIVDYRSDLYSLGVVFYEWLGGRLPFLGEDAMELVHAHLAKSPEPLQELMPDMPLPIAGVVQKLLRKNAEDRYQSAFGLKSDLERCQKLLQETGKIEPFTLATEDFSGRFQIPEKLYGRQWEMEKLLDAFERAAQGSNELLLVAGYSGVGKSALVHEVHRPVTERRGNFIEGKFDQFQRNVPYYAWIQAFKSFVNQLLTENTQRLNIWRQKILQAVGANGKVLTEVIPGLELVIGKQPDVTPLNGAEAQNRFNFVFQNFVNTISRREHPLVIFIDDWQWADAASLNLLKTLLTNNNENYLLIIGAYRDNEVQKGHSFLLTLDEIQHEQVSIQNIHLDNLNEDNISELLCESLKCVKNDCQGLTELIFQKTSGNPFFVTQMLSSLYEEEYLYFDYSQKRWCWEEEKIRKLNISDNVVDLMSSKIQKLPPTTQDILKLAACIGSQFTQEILYIIANQAAQEVENYLESALDEGLLIPLEQGYKFSHDRIQQAIYALIAEDRKQELHLQIGRLLRQKIHYDQYDTYLFDIVNQWNFAKNLLDNEDDKLFLAELNLRAGQKAKNSAAYKPSFTYLQTAISLLPDGAWRHFYHFMLTLYTEAARVALLKGDFDAMGSYREEVIINARSPREQVPLHILQMQRLIAENQQPEALELGLDVLKMLDIELSESTDESLDIERLIDLPNMQDADKQAAMQILDTIITPAWASSPDLFAKICYTIVNLSVAYGNSASSSVGYAFYGGLLCGTFGDIERGYQFGKVAVNLLKRYQAKHLRSKVDNLYVSTVQHWKEPARATRKPHFEAIQMGLETGDFEFASYNIVESSHYHFLMGIDLPTLESKYQSNLTLIKQLKQSFHVQYLLPYQQMIANLRESTDTPSHLKGRFFDEEKDLQPLVDAQQLTLAFIAYQAKSILALLFGDIENAYKSALEAEVYKSGVAGTMFLPAHNFYYSLSIAAYFTKAEASQKGELLEQLFKNQAELKVWAEYAPANYQHKYDLVQAEILRLAGQSEAAMQQYDMAINGAKEHYYIQEEALANELAAYFYLSENRQKIARTYLQDAFYLYHNWGAVAKAESLEQNYVQFIQRKSNSLQATFTSSNTGSHSLDLNTIVKASQTLSGEVVLKQLLKKMMRIVVENAGAERGLLVLNRADGWMLEAETDLNSPEVEALQAVPIESVNGLSDNPKLSTDTIYYVVRTRKSLVIGDAQKPRTIIGKNYLVKRKPKSVLCMPLIKQNQIKGVIYLENNQTSEAFTPSRIKVLDILATQISISLENALLYENLEEKVRERTVEVIEQKEIIEKKNLDITASITYAKRIQDAMLPTMDRVKSLVPEVFVLFKPRDIVSGDFYWVGEAKRDNESSKTLITAVDCTGHGVPGAFMSLIGNDLLNEITTMKGESNPANILAQLHRGVRKALRQEETENRDGMDMAICSIDQEVGLLQFAGAKNPLIYIRDGELHQIRGDKHPIGGLQRGGEPVFTTHDIAIDAEKPTMFYIFSDGYADQFGGLEGRKFMLRKLKALLLEIHEQPLADQQHHLERELANWMQGYKQLDDILLIGFRL